MRIPRAHYPARPLSSEPVRDDDSAAPHSWRREARGGHFQRTPCTANRPRLHGATSLHRRPFTDVPSQLDGPKARGRARRPARRPHPAMKRSHCPSMSSAREAAQAPGQAPPPKRFRAPTQDPAAAERLRLDRLRNRHTWAKPATPLSLSRTVACRGHGSRSHTPVRRGSDRGSEPGRMEKGKLMARGVDGGRP